MGFLPLGIHQQIQFPPSKSTPSHSAGKGWPVPKTFRRMGFEWGFVFLVDIFVARDLQVQKMGKVGKVGSWMHVWIHIVFW